MTAVSQSCTKKNTLTSLFSCSCLGGITSCSVSLSVCTDNQHAVTKHVQLRTLVEARRREPALRAKDRAADED